MNFKEKVKMNIRGYKILNELLPGMFSKTILISIFSQISTYINLYMSAIIINAIVIGESFEKLLFLAILTAVLNLVASLISSFLDKQYSYVFTKFFIVSDLKIKDKIQNMDYELIEDTKIHEDYAMIKALQNSQGRGLFRLFFRAKELTIGLSNIVFSLALVFSAFTGTSIVDLGVWSFIYSPILVIILILVFVFNMLFNFKSKRKVEVNSMKELSQLLDGHRLYLYFFGFMQKYTGAKDIKLYKYDAPIANSIKDIENKLENLIGNIMNFTFKENFKINTLNAVTQCLFYIYITLKALFGAFGVGNIVQYAGALMKLTSGVNTLAFALGDLDGNCEALKKYLDFLDIPNKKYQGTLPVEKRYMCNDGDNDYEIEFKNVSFKYPNTTVYALKNLNFKLKIGKKLAVVGMNGSGKTTMIKLLTRLYDPTEGEILLNGIDIKKYDYKEYMSIFGVVFQDFKLFTFTLGQNVACSTEYDTEKVKDCLIKSGLSERLAKMPKGIDTCIYKNFEEDGVEISGGEAQKIALARALYKDAPFIILDEPTAALDPLAEFEIYSKFNEIVGDKTTVYISHRLSSCKFCDNIAVFDKGELIDQGTHEELLSNENGKYFELWQAQAQYYN